MPEHTPKKESQTTSDAGRKLGLRGGPARARALTQTQRTKIAREGGLARWKKKG